ncbi:MAG: DUF1648 domain-containing protein, partial [Gemmatimonadaceae bacterium]
LLVIVVAFLASAAVYSDLPDRVPTHWNMSGEVDGWMSRERGAFVIPIMLAALLGLFRLLPRIDPRRSNYAKFKSTYETLVLSFMLFLLGVHLMMLAAALGKDISITRVMPIGVGVLFIVLGNLFPRMRPNWFIGVRTPWTLSSDKSWSRTHRLSGHLFVLSGLLTILAALFTPSLASRVLFGSLAVASASMIAYSYVIWKRDLDSKNAAWPGARGR